MGTRIYWYTLVLLFAGMYTHIHHTCATRKSLLRMASTTCGRHWSECEPRPSLDARARVCVCASVMVAVAVVVWGRRCDDEAKRSVVALLYIAVHSSIYPCIHTEIK